MSGEDAEPLGKPVAAWVSERELGLQGATQSPGQGFGGPLHTALLHGFGLVVPRVNADVFRLDGLATGAVTRGKLHP